MPNASAETTDGGAGGGGIDNKQEPMALYDRMMKAIHVGHAWGNKIRMLKLPLILTDTRLYAGAIAQFFELTRTLESRLLDSKEPLLVRVREGLSINATAGYEADLQELFGASWREEVARVRTAATTAYCKQLTEASIVELAAAAFILYGALVVGGGKATQKKVKKVFPSCEHKLFDVAEDMPKARREFKALFTALGKEWPEHADELTRQAARFMALNNTVVLSVRCLPHWWWRVTATVATAGLAVVAARMIKKQGHALPGR
mmetsp:Transcript_56543/g.112439  ORF Transcript_56543/g.112439 Transcript_56543/m.112439 type:complete len:262 (-) Transcript_56543:47-832(-)